MVNGPACAQCGWMLRWIPEQHAWGCDRCRTVQPAMQQPAMQQPQAAQPWNRPGVAASGQPPYAPPAAPYAPAAPGSFAGAAQASRPQSPSTPPQNQALPPAPNPYAPGGAPYSPPPQFPQPAPAPSPYPSAAPYTTPPPQLHQAPHHAHAAPGAPAKGGSKKVLWIAIAAVVLIGGGIGIALAVKGSGGGGGVASRDELAKQMLAALNKGDRDALLALAAPDSLTSSLLECESAADGEGIRKEMQDTLAKLFKERTDQAKGFKIELIELTENKHDTLEKGKQMFKSCKSGATITTYDLEAKLKVAQGDKPAAEQKVSVAMMEVNGGWYLTAPPEIKPVLDCAGAIATYTKASRKALPDISAAAMARMEKKMIEHCNDDGWPEEAVECFAEPKGDHADRCMKILTSSQTDKVMKDLTAIMTQEIKERAPPPDAPTPPTDPLPTEETIDAGVAAGSDVAAGSNTAAPEPASTEFPQICEDWATQISKLQSCRKLPAATRKGMKDSFEILRKSFADMKNKSPAVRQAYETSCKQGVDSTLELRKLCR